MVDHYQIHCKNCGVAMKFPVRTLSQLSAAPEVRPNQLHAIIAACPHCKRLETYTLHKSFPGWNPEDGAVSQHIHCDTVIVLLVECAEENCGVRLPVVAQWDFDTSERGRREDIACWKWADLLCPMGHAIPKLKV
jgi:hypothetical protein